MATITFTSLLERPISEWQEAVNASARDDLFEVQVELSRQIQRMTLLYSYLKHRHIFRSEPEPHLKASQAANWTLANVRGALGYQAPQDLPIAIPT